VKIAVIGAGAMGSLFGGKLTSVTDVWLVDPWAEHVAAMRQNGLELTNPDGTIERISVQAVGTPEEVDGPVDLALIFVKSHSTRWAAEQASTLLAEDGLALTLQNGLGNLEVVAKVVGADRATQGVTAQGATLLGPGRVRHAGEGPTHLARSPGIASQVEEIARLFRSAGLETHLSDDLDSLIWGKLVINVGVNALTAILRVQNGVLVELPPTRKLMAAAVSEAVAVAERKGIALPYDDPVARVEEVAMATSLNRSSMLQDVLRGARTEISVINGAIVREGERIGVPTPVNRTLTWLVQAVEKSNEVHATIDDTSSEAVPLDV